MRVIARELIGRRAELKTLENALAEATRGRLQLVLVSGQAGVGKSALVRRFGDVAAAAGAAVVVAECAREGSLRAFDPFRVVGSGFDDALANVFDARRGSLEPHDRQRMFEAIADRIRTIGRQRPVVLVIEDAQWADEHSAEVPAYLLRRAAATASVVVVTYRTEDAGTAPLAAAIGHFRKRGTAEIDVGPLTRVEVSAFIRSAIDLPEAPDPHLLAFVFERSEGNPFYVEEIIRGLIDQGTLARDDRTWRLARPLAETAVPTSVDESVRARLARMAVEERRLLSTAAVMGQRFAFDPLVAIAACPRATALGAIRAGIQGQLLEESVGEPLWYRFRHALIRDALLAQLLGPERQDLHRAVAATLEAASDPNVHELAYHFDAAGETESAIRYHLAAARGDAGRRGTAVHLERALALAPLDHPDRTEILRRRAAADLFATGVDLARNVHLAEESLARAHQAGDEREVGRSSVVLGILRARLGDPSGADEMRRGVQTLEKFGATPELAGEYVRVAHVAVLGAWPDAVALAERAVELTRAHAAGEPLGPGRALVPHAMTALGVALVGAGRRDGIDTIRAAIALAREVGSQDAVSGGLGSLWGCLLSSGASDDEIREVERSIEAREPGVGGLQVAFFDDDWDRALELASTVPTGSTFAPAAELIRMFIVVAREGPEGSLSAVLRAHERIEAMLQTGSALAAEVLYLCGDARASLDAARYLARWLDRGVHLRFGDGAAIAALAASVELDEATAISEWLDRCARRATLEPATADGRRAYARAERALRDGRPSDATDELARSAAAFEHRGATLLARTLPRLRRAELLAKEDPVAAQKELATVMAMWRAVGAKWYLGRLREWAVARGLRGWTVSARRGPRLTPREIEVARQVAKGLTNKEIGAALGITERTAETHVQRILTKLDLRGRSQLAVWVGGRDRSAASR